MSPARKLYPGDIILTECEFDTTGRRKITYVRINIQIYVGDFNIDWFVCVKGGTSTKDEMCQGYVYIYPRVQLALCKTQYDFDNFFNALGIREVEGEVLERLQLPYKPK